MKNIVDDIDSFKLVELSVGYRLADFESEFEEYSKFLYEDAIVLQDTAISKTHLLLNKSNADIVAYMTLVTDSIRLSNSEKEEHEMEDIVFGSFPAMKIGKLAADLKYSQQYKGIGSFAND
ncbi:MAG: hypothetical protein M0T74_01720 [Desulfitobacterium hafniense]|nr:hypothetical protein [Desulfitobacterium hafniense]